MMTEAQKGPSTRGPRVFQQQRAHKGPSVGMGVLCSGSLKQLHYLLLLILLLLFVSGYAFGHRAALQASP